MTLQWAGYPASQEQLAALAFTPSARGTYQEDMLGAARREGLLTVGVGNLTDLLTEIAAGHPVIVFQNLGLSWFPKWHYAVVVGYDLPSRTVVVNDGLSRRTLLPLKLFLRTWKRGSDWAFVALPPDRLPATGNQISILQAGAALERVGQPGAAAKVYTAGADRWPDGWLWYYGLGNARYALGDLSGARKAFRRALAIDPKAAEARNNLHEVEKELAKRG